MQICANLNHHKKMKVDPSRLIPRKLTETLVLSSVVYSLANTIHIDVLLQAKEIKSSSTWIWWRYVLLCIFLLFLVCFCDCQLTISMV